MAKHVYTLHNSDSSLSDVNIGEIATSEFDTLKDRLRTVETIALGTGLFQGSLSGSFGVHTTHGLLANYATFYVQTPSSRYTTRFVRAGFLTPNEIGILTARTTSYDHYTEAERNSISDILLQAYNMVMEFYREHATKVTDINGAFEDLLVYNWSISGANPPTISFTTGTRITKDGSYWGLMRGYSNQSGYGVSEAITKYSGSGVEATLNTMKANPIYTSFFFVKGDTTSQTLQNAKNGKMYSSINRANYATLNSNGELTERYGRQMSFYATGFARTDNFWNSIFPSNVDLSKITIEEVHEDTDNTYPGGGDDKNDYPDEGSEEPGGESGKGDFDNTNDEVDFPTLPTFDVQSTGFISLWKPTITQLTDLYAFLWDSDIGTTLKKLFNEPMNAIFSLGIIPVDPVTQGTRRLTIGHVDTEIDMESIQKQFVTFDFGSIDINEYYGAAWDYSPYTHASIYLPYIGVQPVDIDDIMNCTLTLRYNIDVLTGTTIALLKCIRKGRDNLNAVMYEWQGNCVTQCPITAGNWSQIMASVIQLGAMTGLALSQPVVGAIGSAVGSSAAAEYAQGKNLVNPTMATYGALNVLGSKVHVQRGGRLDMSSGAMSMQKAFVILNRPVSGIPRGWNKYAGYPSLKIKTLGSQEGFVSVGAIKLDGLRATAEEINELDTILKTGVII